MLKRVSIQNFKSLKDVTLDLQKVNLLIGPNNSGKTNFLKALEVVTHLNSGLNYFDRSLTFLKRKHTTSSLYFIFDQMLPQEDDGFAHYKISSQAEKRFISDKITLKVAVGSNKDIDEFPSDFQEVIIEKERTAPLLNLQNELKNVCIYKPDPNKLDKPAPVGRGDDSVVADASNLIAFFDRIRDEYPESFAQIKADLAKCIPEFTEINFQNVESTPELVKQFGDKTFKRIGLTDGRQKTIYWADELSEGTLYFIALLCIINQPNPPKLLLLEEPEKGIHPRRIFEVIQFIFRLAEEKDVQVIMTTHSPIVVDMFKDMPESVFIFDKDDEGATNVKNLQHDVIEPEKTKSIELGIEPPHYTDSLGDAWMVGFLGGVPK